MASKMTVNAISFVVHRFRSMIVSAKTTKIGDLMRRLEHVVQQLTRVKNFIHGYTDATMKACYSDLALSWSPATLIECETNYRPVFPTDPATAREYQKFNEEISEPFQEQALRLMTTVNVRTHFHYFEST